MEAEDWESEEELWRREAESLFHFGKKGVNVFLINKKMNY